MMYSRQFRFIAFGLAAICGALGSSALLFTLAAPLNFSGETHAAQNKGDGLRRLKEVTFQSKRSRLNNRSYRDAVFQLEHEQKSDELQAINSRIAKYSAALAVGGILGIGGFGLLGLKANKKENHKGK
eukprot:GHVT01069660.1.p1 GENE.GHVT01069660.1~~GHVT01069660.1.p1  ORF type:complete len:128 (-),score=15.92 GHVT01069660.1:849-1232(-)